MKQEDKRGFGELLTATLDLYAVKATAGAVALWWGALEQYAFQDVRRALSEHIQDPTSGRFAPRPADLIGRLQANDGWLEAEEAWAIVSPTLNDESVTVFWTRPMQEAFGVALSLQQDLVAARMAFKEVYTRSLRNARTAGESPVWQMSPGTSAPGRDAAIEEAVRLGRIEQKAAVRLLSHKDGQLPSWLEKSLLLAKPDLEEQSA